jgi:hypothetical protein
MRLLVAVVMALSLSGCSTVQGVWDAYFMAKFDSNEYQYITRVRTHAQLGGAKCGTPEVMEHVKYVYVASNEYQNYAEMIPKNEDSFKLASTLTNITNDFYKRYQGDKPPSNVYCKAKFSAIERSSENIQRVIGAKPR